MSYAFYKLGNAPKSVSAGALPRTPVGKLTALPQTPSWWGGVLAASSPRTPPPPRPFGLRPYRLCCVVLQHPPKINPSYGLGYEISIHH